VTSPSDRDSNHGSYIPTTPDHYENRRAIQLAKAQQYPAVFMATRLSLRCRKPSPVAAENDETSRANVQNVREDSWAHVPSHVLVLTLVKVAHHPGRFSILARPCGMKAVRRVQTRAWLTTRVPLTP
jgi:hypothetical protein